MKRAWSIAGLLSSCSLTLAFRIPSLGWGLPFLFHPDEPTNFSVVQRMLKGHDLNPHFFKYPSLFFYANALVEAVHYGGCRVLGILHSLSDLPELDVPIDGSGFTSLPSAFVAARVFATACAVAIVWIAYRLGRVLSGDVRAGLLSALLVAVSPSVLRDSRWMAPDGAVTLAATATVLASVNMLRLGRARDYVWASVLAGLTASLKYNGGLVAVAVCAAALLRDGRRAYRNPWLYAAPLLAIASFLLTSPFVALDFHGFWRDFMSERAHYATGHDGAEGHTLAFYWEYLRLWEGVGALLAIGGVALGLVRRNRRVIVLSVFCAVYFCFINLFVTRNGQTIVPMLPTLLVLAAWFSVECLAFITSQLERLKVPRVARVALVLASVLLLGYTPFSGSLRRTQLLMVKDNRELASAWVDEHVPPHSRIAIERYACYIDRKRYSLKATRSLDLLEPFWLR
ncbi:MAG TPA: glycosyltransferase family 39 protein, partial [Polyangiaceae bacterium]